MPQIDNLIVLFLIENLIYYFQFYFMKNKISKEGTSKVSQTFHSQFAPNNKIFLRNSCQNFQTESIYKNKRNKHRSSNGSIQEYLYLSIKPQPLRLNNEKNMQLSYHQMRKCHKHSRKQYNYFQEGLIIRNYINWIEKNIKNRIIMNWQKLQTIFYLMCKQKDHLSQVQCNQSNENNEYEKHSKKQNKQQKIENHLNCISQKQPNQKCKHSFANMTRKSHNSSLQGSGKTLNNNIYNTGIKKEGIIQKMTQFNFNFKYFQNKKESLHNIKQKQDHNLKQELTQCRQNLTLQKIKDRISFMHPFLVQFSRQIIIKKQNILLDQILESQKNFNELQMISDMNYQQKKQLVKKIIKKRFQSYEFLNKNLQKLGKNAQKYHDVYKKSLTKFYNSNISLNQIQNIEKQNQIQDLLENLDLISKAIQKKQSFQSIQFKKVKPSKSQKINIIGNKIKKHQRIVSQGQVLSNFLTEDKQNTVLPLTNYQPNIKKIEQQKKKRRPFFLKSQTKQSRSESILAEKEVIEKKLKNQKQSNFKKTSKIIKQSKHNDECIKQLKQLKVQQKKQRKKIKSKVASLQKQKYSIIESQQKHEYYQQEFKQLQNKQQQMQTKTQVKVNKLNNDKHVQNQKQDKTDKFQLKFKRKRYQSMNNRNKVHWFKKKINKNYVQKQMDQILQIEQQKKQQQKKQPTKMIGKDIVKPKIQITSKNRNKKSKKKSPVPALHAEAMNNYLQMPILMLRKQSNKIRRIKFQNLNFLPKKIIQMILRQFDDFNQQKNIIVIKDKLLNYFNKLLEAGCFDERLSLYKKEVEDAIRQYQRKRRTQSQLKSFCLVKSKKQQRIWEQKINIKKDQQNIYECLKSFHNFQQRHTQSTFQKLISIPDEIYDFTLFNLKCKRFSGFNLDLQADIQQNNEEIQQKNLQNMIQKRRFDKQNKLIQFLKAYLKSQGNLLKQKQL